MTEQRSSHGSQSMTIQLEIVPEDAQQQDIADVEEEGRNIVDYLRSSGYIVNPAYTGRMGGPIYDILVQGYSIIHSNEALIASIFSAIAAALKLISNHDKRDVNQQTPHMPTPTPIEITLPTNDGPWRIKAPDSETAIKLV